MNILVVTGSSGGHVFPAISFLEAYCQRFSSARMLFVLPEKNVLSPEIKVPCPVAFLPIEAVRLRFDRRGVRSVARFIKGAFKSLRILVAFKPDIVVGFGSYACVPMVLFAWFFRIKTLVHEQNVVPGKATRIVAPFVDKLALSFASTKAFLGEYHRKIILTGNPLRKELIPCDKKKSARILWFGAGSLYHFGYGRQPG